MLSKSQAPIPTKDHFIILSILPDMLSLLYLEDGTFYIVIYPIYLVYILVY